MAESIAGHAMTGDRSSPAALPVPSLHFFFPFCHPDSFFFGCGQARSRRGLASQRLQRAADIEKGGAV
jgi:hypothetical protein